MRVITGHDVKDDYPYRKVITMFDDAHNLIIRARWRGKRVLIDYVEFCKVWTPIAVYNVHRRDKPGSNRLVSGDGRVLGERWRMACYYFEGLNKSPKPRHPLPEVWSLLQDSLPTALRLEKTGV